MKTLSTILNKRIIKNNSGFTLIEIIVVVVVISILFMVVTPRISHFINQQRDSFALMTGMIAKTFDDSFLHNKINYLTLHLQNPDPEDASMNNDVFSRKNGISVLNIVNGEFVDNKRPSLKYKEFPDSFKIEEVLKPSGEKITNGNVLVPFYPQGYSDNIIIHVLVNDEQEWSVRINKHIKEPKVVEGYATYD